MFVPAGAVEEDAPTSFAYPTLPTIVFLPCNRSPYFQPITSEVSMNAPLAPLRTSIPAPVEVPDPGPVIVKLCPFRMTLLALMSMQSPADVSPCVLERFAVTVYGPDDRSVYRLRSKSLF